MKLFFKILLCIFAMLFTTVGEVYSSTVVNIFQKETLLSSFPESQFSTFIFENHSKISCLKGNSAVTYGERGRKSDAIVAKTGTQTVYRAVNAAERASINNSKSFLLKEGGTEVKYFAKTLQDAHWYGGKLYPEGYSVIKGSLNLSIDAGKYWYPYVDIGAYAFPGNILPYVKPIFP